MKWLYAVFFLIARPRFHPHAHSDKGLRIDSDGILVITLRGTPYERGYQHGWLCRADLERFRADAWHYAPQTAATRLGIPFWIARILIRPMLILLAGSYIPHLTADVKAEMQGLADGADVSIHDVAVLTVIWEIFAMFPQKSQTKPTHCSEIAVNKARSQSASLLGYNYDVIVQTDRLLVDGYMALFVVEPTEGNSYIAPNTIGSIGLNTAMSEYIAFGWDNSYLRAGIAKGSNGTPYMLRLRDIALHATSFEDAALMLRREQRQEADISVIVDQETAGAVELAGLRSAQRTDAVVWSCNRLQTLYDDDYLGAGLTPDGRPERYPFLVSKLPISISPIDIVRLLRDQDTSNGRAIASPNTSFTAVYDLTHQLVWVSFNGSPASLGILSAFDHRGNRIPIRDIV